MNKRSSETRHQHILNDISDNIVSGKWAPGFQLPFEVELAEHYNVSRMTVNKVMTQLVAAGMIERRRKKGSFVRMPQSHAAVLPINEISIEIESLKLSYSFKILSDSIRKADASEKARFHMEDDDFIRSVTCLHYGNQHPFCLEHRVINLASVPEAKDADFSNIAPGNWLVDQVPWSSAHNEIKARNVNAATAKILNIGEHSACLCVERFTKNNIGIVTFVELTYPGERHTIIAEFTPNAS